MLILIAQTVSVDEVMALADSVCQHITNGNCDRSLQSNVLTLSSSLKLYGQQLEAVYKGIFTSFKLYMCFLAVCQN